jgi:hypothetical protein
LAGRKQIEGAAMIKAIVNKKLDAMTKRSRSGPVDDNVTHPTVSNPKSPVIRISF